MRLGCEALAEHFGITNSHEITNGQMWWMVWKMFNRLMEDRKKSNDLMIWWNNEFRGWTDD